MLGYLRVPPENVFDEDGFFHSGDGGFVDDEGRLHWHGRLNDIIKTGGANVSPLEVDAVLATCPGVKIAATVGVPHDTLGELVVACIVPEPGAGARGECDPCLRRQESLELQGPAPRDLPRGVGGRTHGVQ